MESWNMAVCETARTELEVAHIDAIDFDPPALRVIASTAAWRSSSSRAVLTHDGEDDPAGIADQAIDWARRGCRKVRSRKRISRRARRRCEGRAQPPAGPSPVEGAARRPARRAVRRG
jgi:hypothetical protein